MSLRLRLLLIIGVPFMVLWLAASAWMLVELRVQFRAALDERLAASAHMVAGLLAQSPAPASMSPAPTTALGAIDGVACEIRQLRGAIVARTANSPGELGAAAPGYRTRTIAGQRWRSFTLEANGVRVTTADRVERREQLLQGVAAAAAVPVLIAAAGSLLALWFGVRRGLAPLESIRAALAARKSDALHALPATGVPAELAPLVGGINSLLARVAGALERERRFTGDAAHELRTPLTAVKTHIEVARLSADAAGKDVALQNAGEGVLRLQRSIDQLLMLARLDGPFGFAGDDGAAPAAVARAALTQLAPEARGRVTVADDFPDAVLALPATLAVTALRNLLDNAARYAPPDSAIDLRCSAGGGAIVFVVDDRGNGMSAQECARASGRFWRKGGGQGSGLGLSIVDAIARRFGGALDLGARPGGGLRAQLRLPAVAAPAGTP